MRISTFSILFMVGCANKIDRFAIDNVLKKGMQEPDIQKGCALGEAMSFPLKSLTKNSPNKAMVVAETTAALCAELTAYALDKEAAVQNMTIPYEHPNRIAIITDTRINAERTHALAAQRFYNAFTYLEAEYGPLGEACPKIASKDESIFVVGIVAGTLSVLHDKASRNRVGIPMDMLNRIARSASCVSNEDWWYTPMAIQGSIWATIPGSGPQDIDPWEHLQLAAEKGAPTGVRVGWAMHNLIAENAGKTEQLILGVNGHLESLSTHAQNKEWAFLDAYGLFISEHKHDLYWINEKGHRAPSFGDWPKAEENIDTSDDDLFGEDPFGEDPFGTDEPQQTDSTSQ